MANESEWEDIPDDGLRVDGSKKGRGFLGELKRPDGRVSTEVSVGVNLNGKETEIPTLIPTLSQDEIKYILNGGDPRENSEIMRKSIDFAHERIAKGISPFASDSDPQADNTWEDIPVEDEKTGKFPEPKYKSTDLIPKLLFGKAGPLIAKYLPREKMEALAEGALEGIADIPKIVPRMVSGASPGIGLLGAAFPEAREKLISKSEQKIGEVYPNIQRAVGLEPANPERARFQEPEMAALGEIGSQLIPPTQLLQKAPIEALNLERQLGKLAGTLRESASKDISQTLSPTTKEMKAMTEKITEEILNRPFKETFAFTKKGLEEKASTQRELAGEAIEEFGKLKGSVSPNRIIDDLEDLKKPYVVGGKVIDQGSIERIDKVQDIFRQYGDSISQNDLRDIRRAFDNQIRERKGFFKDVNEGTELALKKTASNSIRKILSESNPDLDKLNKQFNFWANLDDVISETNKRIKPQSGLTGNIAAIGGAITGSTPEGIVARAAIGKAVVGAIRSPGWKLVTARAKKILADAIATGDAKKVLSQVDKIQKPPVITDVLKQNLRDELMPGIERNYKQKQQQSVVDDLVSREIKRQMELKRLAEELKSK